MRVRLAFLVMLLVALAVASAPMHAQAGGDDARALRTRLEARYDIVPLSDGIALRPKTRRGDVRLIEVADGSIAINGTPVSGRELREQVGADADAILRLSYLDAEGRRALLEPVDRVTPPAEEVDHADTEAPAVVPEPPEPPEPDSAPSVRRARRARGDRVRIMGDVVVERDESIAGQVVAVLGSVRVDGEVGDQVVAVLGSVDLGPNAVVRGDVVSVGGRVNRAPGAQIRGGVTEVGLGRGVNVAMVPWGVGWGPWWGPFGALPRLVGTVFHLLLLVILAAVVFVFARTTVDRAASRVAEEPLKSTLVGVVVQVLAVPVLILTAILLAISLIGIPLLLLLPFVVLFLLVMALVGFTGSALAIGQWARDRFGFRAESTDTRALDDAGAAQPRVPTFIERPGFLEVCVGVGLILLPLLLGRLLGLAGWPVSPFAGLLIAAGVGIEYLAWTSGFGAVLANTFGSWQARRVARTSLQQPPASPPPSSPQTAASPPTGP